MKGWERRPTSFTEGGSMDEQNVVVTDIQMPFWSMVWFMVKWSIASIPAVIILIVVGGVAIVFAEGALGGIDALLPQ